MGLKLISSCMLMQLVGGGQNCRNEFFRRACRSLLGKSPTSRLARNKSTRGCAISSMIWTLATSFTQRKRREKQGEKGQTTLSERAGVGVQQG